jgi:hypothetical protein
MASQAMHAILYIQAPEKLTRSIRHLTQLLEWDASQIVTTVVSNHKNGLAQSSDR